MSNWNCGWVLLAVCFTIHNYIEVVYFPFYRFYCVIKCSLFFAKKIFTTFAVITKWISKNKIKETSRECSLKGIINFCVYFCFRIGIYERFTEVCFRCNVKFTNSFEWFAKRDGIKKNIKSLIWILIYKIP